MQKKVKLLKQVVERLSTLNKFWGNLFLLLVPVCLTSVSNHVYAQVDINDLVKGKRVQIVTFQDYYQEDDHVRVLNDFILSEVNSLLLKHSSTVEPIEFLDFDKHYEVNKHRSWKLFTELKTLRENRVKRYLDTVGNADVTFAFRPITTYKVIDSAGSTESFFYDYSRKSFVSPDQNIKISDGATLLGFVYDVYENKKHSYHGIFSLKRDYIKDVLEERTDRGVTELSPITLSQKYNINFMETEDSLKKRFAKILNKNFKLKKKVEVQERTDAFRPMHSMDLYDQTTAENVCFVIMEGSLSLLKIDQLVVEDYMVNKDNVFMLPAGMRSLWLKDIVYQTATGANKIYSDYKKIDYEFEAGGVYKIIEIGGKFKVKKYNKKVILSGKGSPITDSGVSTIDIRTGFNDSVTMDGLQWMNVGGYVSKKIKSGYHSMKVKRGGLERWVLFYADPGKNYMVNVDKNDKRLKKIRVNEVEL